MQVTLICFNPKLRLHLSTTVVAHSVPADTAVEILLTTGHLLGQACLYGAISSSIP